MDRARELFSKEMTRQEFLKTIAVAIFVMVGFGNFVSYLKSQGAPLTNRDTPRSGGGFGSRKFGD